MRKIRIRAIFKSKGFKKSEKYHNDTIYMNSKNKHIYLVLERESYNMNLQLYGKNQAGKLLLNYLSDDNI